MASLTQVAMPSLRDIQRKLLFKVLNLNSTDVETTLANDGLPQVENTEPVWKFLIFDQLGQNVISSVLRVNDLREAGVTVHMHLKANRHPMEDVPASIPMPRKSLMLVYLVEPTAENINLIADVQIHAKTRLTKGSTTETLRFCIYQFPVLHSSTPSRNTCQPGCRRQCLRSCYTIIRSISQLHRHRRQSLQLRNPRSIPYAQ